MNENAKRLHKQIVAGFEIGPLVRIDVQAYADSLGVSLRSAQRYFKELEVRSEYETIRRAHDGARYFKQAGSPASFVYLFENAKWQQIAGSVVFVASDKLSFNIDLKEDTTDSNRNLNGNTYSVSQATSETTKATSDDESGSGSVQIWFADTDGDFRELANAVCEVCRLNPLLLLEEDEQKIARMFKAGISPDELRKRYGINNRPNYWFNMYWKGKRGARPTIVDLMQTWEQSAGYVYEKHHSWPTVSEIQEQFISVMKDAQRDQKTAMAMLSKYGYDEIINRIEGGYYHLTIVNETKAKVLIANAVGEIKSEAYKAKELAT